MYERYNPGNLGNVHVILDDYAGSEEMLMENLITKYGAEPQEVKYSARAKIIRIVRHYHPSRLPSLPPLIGEHIHFLDILAQSIEKQYGPEPANPYLDRITRFYAMYVPDKIPNIPIVLDDHAGNEETLMRNLIEKYGPEPIANYADLVRQTYHSPSPSSRSKVKRMDWHKYATADVLEGNRRREQSLMQSPYADLLSPSPSRGRHTVVKKPTSSSDSESEEDLPPPPTP